MEELGTPKNWTRRGVGIAACLSPVVLLVSSLATALGDRPSHMFEFAWVTAGAMFVALLNFYLSFIRPALMARRLGTMEGIRHVSGFPLVGTVLVVIGGILGFGAAGTAVIGLVALALDTGGAPWFLASTWQDSSLWDARAPASD